MKILSEKKQLTAVFFSIFFYLVYFVNPSVLFSCQYVYATMPDRYDQLPLAQDTIMTMIKHSTIT